MFIADSQVHVWAANTPERPWRAGVHPHREVPLQVDELLREMDVAGVYRAVLIPPFWDADRNDLVLEAARLHPDRLAAMGRIDTDAANARALTANWRQQPGMLGLRFSYSLNRPYLRRVYDAFGPRRIFWGTDLARLPCSYRQAVTMFTEEIPWLTAEDKEWIMGRGLCEWIGWKLPAA